VVPRWLGYYEPLSTLLPYRFGRMMMGALGADSQVAALDADQRQAYQARLDAHISQTRDST